MGDALAARRASTRRCRPRSARSGIVHVLDILTSNPAVWEKTALIVSYDENGGFFDHVAAAGRRRRARREST